MTTFHKKTSAHTSEQEKHICRTDAKMLKSVSADAQAWLQEAMDFFSSHEYYAHCKDELEGYYLSVFGVVEESAETSIQTQACRYLVQEYRTNDFVLGISAKLIQTHGRQEGAKLAEAFRRVWESGGGFQLT